MQIYKRKASKSAWRLPKEIGVPPSSFLMGFSWIFNDLPLETIPMTMKSPRNGYGSKPWPPVHNNSHHAKNDLHPAFHSYRLIGCCGATHSWMVKPRTRGWLNPYVGRDMLHHIKITSQHGASSGAGLYVLKSQRPEILLSGLAEGCGNQRKPRGTSEGEKSRTTTIEQK